MKDLQQRISSLEEQNLKISNEIAALKKQLEAPEKKERWRGKEYENFFYIDDEMFIQENTEELSEIDKNRFNTFNYFQTREEAERIARVQLAYRKLDCAIRQCELANYGKTGYIFLYRTDVGKVEWDYAKHTRSPLPIIGNKKHADYILSNYQSELLTFLTGGEK